MVKSLRGTAEIEGGLRLLGRGGGGVFQTGEACEFPGEFRRVDKLLHGLGVPLPGNHRRGRETVVGDGLDSSEKPGGVCGGYDGGGGDEVKQALPRVTIGRDIGGHGNRVYLLFRQLCLDVESAYRLDFVAEQVDTVREFPRISENIDD